MGFDRANLLSCLDVRATGEDRYQGDNYDLTYRRVFGGQVLGQVIRCLSASGGGKQVKSFTFHFTREGDPDLPVDLRVETHQSGRSFATCGVTVSQATAEGERVIGLATALLHAAEDGPTREDPAPDVPGPDDSEPREQRILPWEVRVVDGVDLTDPTPRPADYRVWMRAADLAETAPVDDQWLHQALLAHASESTVIGTALLPLADISQADAGVKFGSSVMSHSMWFHAPVRFDEWLLIDQHSPVLTGGRAFGTADVWSHDGRLVASLAQESMVRLRPA